MPENSSPAMTGHRSARNSTSWVSAINMMEIDGRTEVKHGASQFLLALCLSCFVNYHFCRLAIRPWSCAFTQVERLKFVAIIGVTFEIQGLCDGGEVRVFLILWCHFTVFSMQNCYVWILALALLISISKYTLCKDMNVIREYTVYYPLTKRIGYPH